MPADPIRVGDLRYSVILAKRTDTPSDDLSDPTLVERYSNRTPIRANIVPTGTMAFLSSIQTEINAITHRITIRWRPGIDKNHFILRTTTLPDGSSQEDVYRIHRVGEWQGRNRFLILEAELERRDI